MASPTVQIQVTAPLSEAHKTVLTEEAVAFLKKLASTFEPGRQKILAQRRERQARLDQGELPDFLPETEHIRKANWVVASIPADLMDRRVEITGPVDRKMIINALNSGANVFMADFEDSNSPTWANNLDGHINLRDAVNRTITYTSPEGKSYKLNEKIATLLVRPRGWHLEEKHFLVDGKPISGALFDFGLFFFHNAKSLLAHGTGPYFYLPKIESHQEARLWNDIFNFSQDYVGIPRGTVRATVLIETILAAFEMDEIMYELKEHSSGLNCGRWDYIFSFIKKFDLRPDFILPNRAEVTMTQHFLASYVALLIQQCHRRNAHAMGGMAAQIPIKNDPVANEQAMAKVREDKIREVKAGHDGTWVAHPGLVGVAKDIFDEYMKGPNQIHVKREDVHVTAKDLLEIPKGSITRQGLRWNIDVGLQYLASWLAGNGCVPIYNLMEDAATAEISRTQVWQWVKHGAKLDTGETVTAQMAKDTLAEVLDGIKGKMGEAKFNASTFPAAGKIMGELMTSPNFHEFLTLDAYRVLA
jgi:malate synthase